jgi:tRNA modification GTPase
VYHVDDTIAAIASAAGGAARGILRVSGPDVVRVLDGLFRASTGESPADVTVARRLSGLICLEHSAWGRLDIPGDLYYWPGKRSYTREPLAEFHTLGSPPLLAAALGAVCAAGARVAQPGEFTLRAFLAGRLDLTQAEAVAGVIDAAGPRDLEVALTQLAGGLGQPLHHLRDQLLDLLAHLEAGLDFVEEDIEFIAREELSAQLGAAIAVVERLVERMVRRTSAVDLPRVVLVGSPNVGKSSLFNALSGGSGAIVANQPGTTRDLVSARLDLGGQSCELVDTAGIDSPTVLSTQIEFAAQQFATAARHDADVCVLCLDASRPANYREQVELLALTIDSEPPERVLLVQTKCDAACAGESQYVQLLPGAVMPSLIQTSSVTGVGLLALRAELKRRLLARRQADGGVVLPTAERASVSLREAAASLSRALSIVDSELGDELVAAELRGALDALGQVVGAVYTDDILDRVFSRFCIGK